MAEQTMFLDCHGEDICLGSIIRAPVEINQTVHGEWAEYEIRKAPGGYVLSYRCSEKGAVLPPGYTGGFMADSLPDADERDLKSLIFATVPLRVEGWIIVPPGQEGQTWDEERGRTGEPA
jgi:hypothetical protein